MCTLCTLCQQMLTARMSDMEQSRASDAAALREALQLRTTCEEMRAQLETHHKDVHALRQLLHKSEQALQESELKALQVGVGGTHGTYTQHSGQAWRSSCLIHYKPYCPPIQAEGEVRDARGSAEDAVAARDRALAAKTGAEAELAAAQRQALVMRSQVRKVPYKRLRASRDTYVCVVPCGQEAEAETAARLAAAERALERRAAELEHLQLQVACWVVVPCCNRHEEEMHVDTRHNRLKCVPSREVLLARHHCRCPP